MMACNRLWQSAEQDAARLAGLLDKALNAGHMSELPDPDECRAALTAHEERVKP